MEHFSDLTRKQLLADGNLRIYNILKNELKMDAPHARELLAEINHIINDRFHDTMQYVKTIAEINERNINEGINQIKRRTDQIANRFEHQTNLADETNEQNLALLEKRIENTADKLNRLAAEVSDPFNPGFMKRLYWMLAAIGSALIIAAVLFASR